MQLLGSNKLGLQCFWVLDSCYEVMLWVKNNCLSTVVISRVLLCVVRVIHIWVFWMVSRVLLCSFNGVFEAVKLLFFVGVLLGCST